MNTIQGNLHKWETNLKPLASVVDDLISRQAAVGAIRAMQTYKLFSGDDLILVDQAGAQTELMMLPPAQQEQRWIPFQFRLITDEEKEEYEEYFDWDIGEDAEILCGERPDDGQEILVSYNGYVFTDTFEIDEGYYLDGMGEIEHGMAWQPLPKPYQADVREERE